MKNSSLILQIRTYNQFVLIGGLVLLAAGVFAALVLNTTNWWNLTLVVLGLVLLVIFLIVNLTEVKEMGKKRSTVARANLTLVAVAMLGIIAALNYIVSRHPLRFDLTSNKFYTLSDQTLDCLSHLTQDVNVSFLTASARNDQMQGQVQKAEQLLQEYAKKTTKFHFKIVDIDKDPSEARRLGIHENNTVVFESGENRKDVLQRDYITYSMQGRQPIPKFQGEAAFTSALLTMSDTSHLVFYFTEGHGEKDINNPQPEGYHTFKDMLEKENYTVKTVNLLKDGKVPADAAGIAVVGPAKAFQASEADLLDKYLKQGGKLVLCVDLLDSVSRRVISDTGLSPILRDFGVKLGTDVAIDETSFLPPNASAVFPQYVSHPIDEKLSQSHIPTLMVFNRSVQKIEPILKNVTQTVFLQTTDKGWGVNNIKEKPVFHPGVDAKGPISMAIACEWLLPDGSGKKSRLVVFGNSTFFSNQFVGTLGNLDMALNTFGWLAEQENKISIHPKEEENRSLTLTNVSMSFIFYIAVIIIPLGALIAGFVIWYRRRSI